MIVFVPAYWPLFRTTEVRQFDYHLDGVEAPQFSSTFSYDQQTDSMLYVDHDKNDVWTDTWRYQYRPGFGIAEWRDSYPGGKTKTFSTPIGWGDWQQIGSVYTNRPFVDIFRTWPPSLPLWGYQMVAYEAMIPQITLRDGSTYSDVLQFVYQQTWGGKTGGARYWMARGVGPVALQWVAPDPHTGQMITTARYDAKIIRGNG